MSHPGPPDRFPNRSYTFGRLDATDDGLSFSIQYKIENSGLGISSFDEKTAHLARIITESGMTLIPSNKKIITPSHVRLTAPGFDDLCIYFTTQDLNQKIKIIAKLHQKNPSIAVDHFALGGLMVSSFGLFVIFFLLTLFSGAGFTVALLVGAFAASALFIAMFKQAKNERLYLINFMNSVRRYNLSNSSLSDDK